MKTLQEKGLIKGETHRHPTYHNAKDGVDSFSITAALPVVSAITQLTGTASRFIFMCLL